MKSLSTAPLALIFYSLCFVSNPLFATSPSAGLQDHAVLSTVGVWSSQKLSTWMDFRYKAQQKST